MKFDPTAKDDGEKKGEFETWPDGDYDAVVVAAEEGLSKKQNPQTVVELDVFDDANNRKQKVWDYMGAAAVWKIEMFMNACDLSDEFMSGDLNPAATIGKNIVVSLRTQPAKDGFKAKNTVKAYMKERPQPKSKAKPTGVPVQQQRQAAKAAPTEDCPF